MNQCMGRMILREMRMGMKTVRPKTSVAVARYLYMYINPLP